MYNSCGAIKNDIKETERIIDLIQLGRQQKRRNVIFEKKQMQRQRLKDAFSSEPRMIGIKSLVGLNCFNLSAFCFLRYMTAMGALSLKVDARTQDRLRQRNNEQDNELLHRRQSLSIAFQDIGGNIRGSLLFVFSH